MASWQWLDAIQRVQQARAGRRSRNVESAASTDGPWRSAKEMLGFSGMGRGVRSVGIPPANRSFRCSTGEWLSCCLNLFSARLLAGCVL